MRRGLQSSVRAAEGVCMRSAFRAAWAISAACAFVLLMACSQGVSADGPAEDSIDTASPSDGLVRYQDPEGHFAVSYPVGWNVDRRPLTTIFTPDASDPYPRVYVSALSFTTKPLYGEPPKAQVRHQFEVLEELGFVPGLRMLDEGPWELGGERAYFAIYVEEATGIPRVHLVGVALVSNRSYHFALIAPPRDFERFLPTAQEMADSLEIQG